MPSALPAGDPRPADGSLPESALRDARGSGRSGSTCTCRSARCGAATATSTPTPPTSSAAGRVAGDVRRGRDRRDPAGPPGARRRRPAGRRRSSSAAARRPCCRRGDLARVLAAIGGEFGLAADAEVTTEANPDSVTPADLDAAARRPASTGSRSACSPRCRTCWPRWTAPTTRCGCPQVVAAGRGRPGFEQVSLDLIYGTPGGVARRLGGLARRGAGLRARPRLGVRADRGGRHRAGPAGTPRRGADARRRRPRRQVPRSPTRR